MGVYIVITNYFMNGFFGVYTTVKRARIAFERFLAEDNDVITVEDVDNYSYTFTTRSGAQFSAEIMWSDIDEEFKEELIKEDEQFMKCPNCGNETYAIDTLDSDYCGDSYYDSVEGTCSNCGKSWRWVEVFTFDRYEDIEEIEIDDHL